MTFYLSVYSLIALTAVAASFVTEAKSHTRLLLLGWLALLLILVGFRWEIGADWDPYARLAESARWIPTTDYLLITDPGYALINLVASKAGGGIVLVNFACSAIFCLGLGRFLHTRKAPLMGLAVATPYLIFIVAMNYVRQATAIGFILMAIVALEKTQRRRAIVLLIAACLFHKTAVVFLAIAMLSFSKTALRSSLWVLALVPVAYITILAESVDRFSSLYLERDYASRGAQLRTLQLALCGVAYLVLPSLKVSSAPVHRLWVNCSILGLAAFTATTVFPSSTAAIDRLALYLSPLMLQSLTSISASWRKTPANVAATVGILGLMLATLVVWLVSSQYIEAWVPYRSILL